MRDVFTRFILKQRIYIMNDCIIGIDHDTVCAGVVGTAIRHSANRISGQFYSTTITILQKQKSKGNLRFQRLVPLFVPIGVCVTTHDDGTASDVTIGM